MLACMPHQRNDKPSGAKDSQSSASRRRVCTALTTSGSRCKRTAVTGLKVCKSHGGGTAASVRAGKVEAASQQVAKLWGISPGASGISVVDELNKLANAKITDILALRIELSREGAKHIGMLRDGQEVTDAEVGDDIYTTVKTKKSAGVSPWVAELHKAEGELLQILKLLQEVTGGTEQVDKKRIQMQAARNAARLLKAFPGLSVDDIAAEVSKHA